MRKLQYLLVLAAAALISTSCADSYLDQYPGGASITEDQYYAMDQAVEGTVKGVYPLLYAYGGDHDSFGQRSIDMYGDLLCGDMAMNTFNYGWFQTDELGQTYTRRGTFWVFYYDIIRACNKGLNALESLGVPPLTFDVDTMTTEKLKNGMYYAELLTMRGWAYGNLSHYFVEQGEDLATLCIPIYTQDDTRADTIIGAPRSTVGDLYLRIEQDLLTAIQYFEAYNNTYIERSSKIEVNGDVARILLAYSYLNKGDNTNALKYAQEAITKGTPSLLPVAEVLTTGFNDVTHPNWIWGEDVTVQNTTSLASFFGQCDIYSYSYAGAGDVKGIDKNLYESIQAWDIRQFWWNNYAQSGKKSAKMYEYAPDGKFYTNKTEKKIEGDRDWLSDNIYMRWEVAYLIAAEAACRNHDVTNAQAYLFAITDKRVIDTEAAAYATWQAGMANEISLLDAIEHNWRVEMWGEGYGLQTFRRYGNNRTLGENHKRAKKDISPTTARVFTFEIPNSEQYYNPFFRTTDDTKNLRKKN